jgi:hypothetical protein
MTAIGGIITHAIVMMSLFDATAIVGRRSFTKTA